jgi:(p)ppGpp synthase/HD superfamily hydrolase
MIYTEMTKKALQISFDAHRNQLDRAGLPYVYHPYHLAERMEDETSVCAALLHDVVEDTELTFDDLIAQGISQEVVDALRLLTHPEGMPYMEYVRRIAASGNPHAIRVKLADLHHNSDLTRLPRVDEAALKRREKYLAAISLLTLSKRGGADECPDSAP